MDTGTADHVDSTHLRDKFIDILSYLVAHRFFTSHSIYHMIFLLPEIPYAGHYHYVKMLVDNANSVGATIAVEN